MLQLSPRPCFERWQLQNQLTPAKRRAFECATSSEAWVNETLALSRRYAFLTRTDRVDDTYERTRWPIVTEQLQKAGCASPRARARFPRAPYDLDSLAVKRAPRTRAELL